ncbi:hypothetical protein ASG32_07945 [Methylobacterium sp. Leaf361]|uniref:hypothetical protein n=1 Tax=Methylobacterium sp. Leaf361 TaxID=1736352 RepID=UPI000700F692|nr:hypothetical protein [Methylobacterium sp. Leaf361]KQS75018.1 hypothetical protein ASG32_07945 [Methylobacterium sp. Leaf361]
MRTRVIDKTGVEMAGPDTPGLAAAEAREGNTVLMAGSAGAVSRDQAGILPMRGMELTPEMVDAAVNAAAGLGRALDPSEARAILKASLSARSRA